MRLCNTLARRWQRRCRACSNGSRNDQQTRQYQFAPIYSDELSIKQKIEKVAKEIYHAGFVSYTKQAERQLADLVARGCDTLPVCIAKTQYSFSADPKLLGAPEGFELSVRELLERGRRLCCRNDRRNYCRAWSAQSPRCRIDRYQRKRRYRWSLLISQVIH